ncbi:MAG: SufD family Fe-S cluster assembly protein [Candidatus Ratteibacteria bacterium]|nr:SufD family Fe-S cluster assembly protein [Candidatus Ratteibacteria bacterium]
MQKQKTKTRTPSPGKINIESYKAKVKSWGYLENLQKLGSGQKENMLSAGIDPSQKGRSGTYLQMDHSVVHSKSLYPGLEVMSISQALKKHEWLNNYFWKVISIEADDFTKQAQRQPHQGYFLRALPGVKTVYPLQACLFINENNIIQNVHNIIIAEEGSDLEVITGCAAAGDVRRGLHIGISEFYVKKGAKLTFTMIHNWAEDVAVRPRTATLVEEGGAFLSNYICLKPVKTLQMCPKAELVGGGALARYNSILFASSGTHLDVGSRVILKAEASRAEVISRAVSAGGHIIARGHLIGEAKGIKAHLECRGLMLAEKGLIDAIPELEGNVKGVEMSHEAAVGKIARDEIEYLMARGLSQDEAQAAIVRGFLDTSIMGLPEVLQKEVDKAVATYPVGEGL